MWNPFRREPEVGDVVILPDGVTSSLFQGAVRPNTRGYVHGKTWWGDLDLEIDDGLFGTRHITVPARKTRVHISGASRTSWSRNIRIRTVIRLAAALILAWPFLLYAIDYIRYFGSLRGFLYYTATTALPDSVVEMFNFMIHNPGEALFEALLASALSYIAFGPRRRKKHR